MQIRRAEIADEEALKQIRRRSILALASSAVPVEQAEAWAGRPAPDRIARAIREHDLWVAVEEAAIGWAEVDGDRVAALYVSPTASSRGVGSELLRVAEAAIRRSGHATARLEASENALDFYLRRGWIHAGALLADGSYPLSKDLIAAA